MASELARAVARATAAKRAMVEAFNALAAVVDGVEAAVERGAINALLWECAAGQPVRSRFFSQYGQDAYLDTHVFGSRRDGVFVDVGGFDGVTGSNTLFFEIFRGWRGLLVEAVDEHFEVARSFRRCECVQALVGDGAPAEFLTVDSGPVQMSGLSASYDPKRRAWVDGQPNLSLRTEVRETRLLADLLRAHHLHRVDLVSLDIEGAEAGVLAAFPFAEFEVECWCVETAENPEPVAEIMIANGYEWFERIGHDDLFVPRGRA
ncbi:MAG: FkbM family methyltransferase [Gammaproteobacteria bacterium]|nr:FkbM family methyltransferase [Gammaproteobacteria bacterium]